MELIKQTLLYTFHNKGKKQNMNLPLKLEAVRSGKKKCMKRQSNVYMKHEESVEASEKTF